MSTRRVILTRHGENEFLKNNLFCGWVDSPLTENGKLQAIEAGKLLRKANYKIDMCYTSVLSRSVDTLKLMLSNIGQCRTPICEHWRLNERHYGALTGLNKLQTQEKYGKEQVQLWRRSYDVAPPPMERNHPYYDQIRNDPRYKKDGPDCQDFPTTESLKTTLERVLPLWEGTIVPQLKLGKTILVVSHGTVTRSLLQHLEKLSNDEINHINIPPAFPFVYEFDCNFKMVVTRKFLADAATVKKALETVAGITYKS